MARRPRVHFPNAFYHVIVRGNQRQPIFLDSKDYQAYLVYLSEYKLQYQFHLYAYALMRNHVYLLLELEETPFKMEDHIQKDEELAKRIALLQRNLIKKRKKKYLISVA